MRELDIKDDIEVNGKKYQVSTVSLFDSCSEVIISLAGYRYETMVFPYIDGEVKYRDLYCDRYNRKEDAITTHKAIVKALREGKLELALYRLEE